MTTPRCGCGDPSKPDTKRLCLGPCKQPLCPDCPPVCLGCQDRVRLDDDHPDNLKPWHER